jgi:chromosome segregation ATPase
MASFEPTDADAAALGKSEDLKARFEAITGECSEENLDLDAASAKLEAMSAELDSFLAELERDLPADVKAQFDEAEKRVEEEENEAIRRDPAESMSELQSRASRATKAASTTLEEAQALEKEQRKLQLEGIAAHEDLEKAAKELQELRDAFELCTGGSEGESEVEKELRRMQEKKYGHEESKADDLDPAHRKLINDATPASDLEHGHMELVMNKMRYASLGVENEQLRAQIAELKALNALAEEEGVPSAPE